MRKNNNKKIQRGFFNYIDEILSKINLNDTLSILSVNEESITVSGRPKASNELYVIKLHETNNLFRPLGMEALYNSFMHEDEPSLTYYYVRKNGYHINYIASFNKKIADYIGKVFDQELLDGREIFRFLMDIYYGNEYFFNETDYVLESRIDFDDINTENMVDPLYLHFRDIIKERVYDLDKNFDMYQILKMKKTLTTDMSVFSKTNFNGVLALNVNLSKSFVEKKLQSISDYSDMFDKRIKQETEDFIEEYEKLSLPIVTTNGYILTKDDRAAMIVADKLNFDIEKKVIHKKDILSKSLMITRDLDLDILIDAKRLDYFTGSFTRKIMNTKDIKEIGSSLDFWGHDIFGSFANYSFRANKNPHAFIVAPSGSGKSFTLLKIISQIIRYNFDTGIAEGIDDKYIRFFDVGFTGLKFTTAIKEYHGKRKVALLESRLNDIKFSLFDVKLTASGIPQTEEYVYMLSMMDIILEINDETVLSGLDRQELIAAINSLFTNRDYEFLTISKLRDLGYDVTRLYELGYVDFNKMDKVKEPEFNKYKVPMISDLIQELDKRYRDSTTTETRKKILEKLVLKIRVIDSIGFFSYFNKTDLDFKNFYYMDFQHIKSNSKVFVAIFWFFLNTLYRMDVEDALSARERGEEPKNKYYIIEEAHNFLKLKAFSNLFEVMSREARKYRIHLIFVSQDLGDVPAKIMTNIATKMLIYPRQQKDVDRMVKQIDEIFSTNSTIMQRVFEQLERYTMLLDSDLGTFGMRFDISPKEFELFTLN